MPDQAEKARDTALQGALARIERQFGKGTVMRMGDKGAQVARRGNSHGGLPLDLALGPSAAGRAAHRRGLRPGVLGQDHARLPRPGRGTEAGRMCAFIDTEHAMDPLLARSLGMNIDELLVSQPDYGEQGLEVADVLRPLRRHRRRVAIGSVAALTPRAELKGQIGDRTVSVQARMMSQAMRELAGDLNRTKTLCLFVNQNAARRSA